MPSEFSLSESFLNKYKRKKPSFGFNGLGELVYNRCVTIDTKILCQDLKWRNAGDLKEGDKIIAFNEKLDTNTKERYVELATITHNKIQDAEVVEIELENGELLYSTPDHRWLAFKHGSFKWVYATDLGVGENGALTYLSKWCDEWEQDSSYESGFLAAAFDGEGSLDGTCNVVFTQTDNEMLERVEKYLSIKGFQFSKKKKTRPKESSIVKSNKDCWDITIIGGQPELLRFFGTIRPTRLINKYLSRVEDMSFRCQTSKRVAVKAVRSAGVKKIAVMSTSSKTHITAGYPSHNTYSRIKENGKNERWWQTIKRVVEGTYCMQKEWIDSNDLEWNPWKAQHSAQEMYSRMYSMKFLPPGRGMWAMGSPITREKKLFAALNNCGFTSTKDIKDDIAKPFCFLMDMSMLGVGVGFDTEGAGKIEVKGPNKRRNTEIYTISDDREGWVESVRLLIESYLLGTAPVSYVYDKIRKAGLPIKGFGGVSSGPEPLVELHNAIRSILDLNVGSPITVTTIVDIMNLIGVCVVAGNVRRTAEIVFGDPECDEYLDLKNYDVNPHRGEYGWTSNNSIFAKLGMNYGPCADRTRINGEPGYAWLENMQKYSRMCDPPDYKDRRVIGGNPCLEQSLESYELCNLVETFPANHSDLEDFKKTLKYAYLYAKTVTLGKTHWTETNRVMLRNRRIGTSMSGIAQFVHRRGLDTLKQWCEGGYSYISDLDTEYSEWLAVPVSRKKTSIKPSGSVSLLAGATPGKHWPEALWYIRRMRLSIHSDLIAPLKEAGYHVEPCVGQEDSTVVVEVPVYIGEDLRTVSEVSIWEQFSMAAFLQRYWADNQVSSTVTFNPETEGGEIEHCLDFFQYQLKGISLLPKTEQGAYAQMPYEEITKEKYEELTAGLKTLKIGTIKDEEADIERFCDGDKCVIGSK